MDNETLLSSHLKPADVVGKFVEVDALDFGEERPTPAYVTKWVSGAWLLDGGPAVHELLLSGRRRVEAQLLCAANVGRPAGARSFRRLQGVPDWLVAAERVDAAAARQRWGERFGGGAQLEVTVFAARGLDGADSSTPVQLIARTLCVGAKTVAKALAPAIYERRGEFHFAADGAGDLAATWARAAARAGAEDVDAGLEWVRRKILTEKVGSPEVAAAKDKVKVLGSAGPAPVFLDAAAMKESGGVPAPKRIVLPARHRGTRLKIELKLRGRSGTTNVGSLDMLVDDLIVRNAEYVVFQESSVVVHDTTLQIRLFYLDPAASDFDDAQTATLAPVAAVGERGPADAAAADDGAAAATQQDGAAPEEAAPGEPVEEDATEPEEPVELGAEEQSEEGVPKRKPPPPPPRRAKPPPPPPKPSRPSISLDLQAQLAAGPAGLKKADEPPAPARPCIDLGLASQLKSGAQGLKPAADRALAPAAASGESLFETLASKIGTMRADLADEDDEDDDEDWND